MLRISYPNVIIGAYSYVVALKDGISFGSSLKKVDSEYKVQSIFREVFPPLIALLASSSWALLWTHSVGIIHIGRYFSSVEKVCFSAFSLFYGKEACLKGVEILHYFQSHSLKSIKKSPESVALLQSGLWDLIGAVSLLAWSVLSLMSVTCGVAGGSAISLVFLVSGSISLTLSYLHRIPLGDGKGVEAS